MKKYLFIILLFSGFYKGSAKVCNYSFSEKKYSNFLETKLSSAQRPNPYLFSFIKKNNKRKKIIAASLAFPLPFGILGLHRLYLGTKPYVPLVYIVTLGGGVGILPFIDFCVLVLDKDITRFNGNPHVFMWVDNKEQTTEKQPSYD